MPRAVRERPRRAGAPRLLLDTNVLLDVVLDRAPWADDATRLLQRIHEGAARGFVASHALTTVHYVVERDAGRARATTAVSDFMELLDVVPLDASDFQRALALDLRDFEDAVQVAACLKAEADVLVTRNPRDFRHAPVEIRSAADVLPILHRSAP